MDIPTPDRASGMDRRKILAAIEESGDASLIGIREARKTSPAIDPAMYARMAPEIENPSRTSESIATSFTAPQLTPAPRIKPNSLRPNPTPR
jgi:hypothetical protein